jgi:acyl-CoA thioesterase
MGDLRADVALADLGDGTYTCTLSRDWEIWGPNGGYMAAIALEAARRGGGRARPANVTVHFLGVASFDEPVIATPTVLRSTRVATSVQVELRQAGRPILHAMVWSIDDGVEGLVHDSAPMPGVAGHWSQHPTNAERWAMMGREQPTTYRFWRNVEQRPPTWIDDWDDRHGLEPEYLEWIRFVAPADDDPWAEAARLTLLVDLGAWPAVTRAHVQQRLYAPSIDVSCEFHRLGTPDGWYFLRGHSPFAGDGLVASHQQVWSSDGRLVASGISHLLCRPLP